MVMDYEMNFLKALACTICIETIVLYLLIKLLYKLPDIKNWQLLLTGISASFSTLPYLWFILPVFIKTRITYSIIGEVIVIIIESALIFGLLRISYKRSLITSVACNMASFLAGFFIHWT